MGEQSEAICRMMGSNCGDNTATEQVMALLLDEHTVMYIIHVAML